MKTIILGLVIICIGAACADGAERSLTARATSAEGKLPFWLIRALQNGANSVQTVEVPVSADDFTDDDQPDYNNNDVQDDDDDDVSSCNGHINADNFESEDDDEDSELTGNVVGIISINEGNAISSNRKDEAEVGMIDLEDNETDYDDEDEESGETAVFLTRRALQNIPNGSILALVDDSESTGRATKSKKYTRIRRVKNRRRGGNNQRRRRRRRRPVYQRRRPSIRVIQPGRGGNRVRNRRRRPNVIRI